MTNRRILELLEIERECVKRNAASVLRCDRDCARCDLAQSDAELLEMYDEIIDFWHVMMERGLLK